jgi:hypothetical protein
MEVAMVKAKKTLPDMSQSNDCWSSVPSSNAWMSLTSVVQLAESSNTAHVSVQSDADML